MQASLLPLLEQWHQELPEDQRHRVQLEPGAELADCWVLVDVNALHLVLDNLLDIDDLDSPVGAGLTVAIDAAQQICRVMVKGRSTEGLDLEFPLVRQLVEAWKGELTCRWSSANDAPCLCVVFTIPRIPSPGMQAIGEVDQTDQA